MNIRQIATLLIGVTCLAACGKKKAAGDADDPSFPYFSIKQFTADQIKNHLGSPFVLIKYSEVDGKKDSTIMNSYNADWGEAIKAFSETDINDLKFKGKYNVSTFKDDATGAIVFYYEAKEKTLFTRSVQLRIDDETHRIMTIYIETVKNSFWHNTSQKLYYEPMKEIQIQQFDKPLIGHAETRRYNWLFNGGQVTTSTGDER